MAEQIQAQAPDMPIILLSEVTDARLLESYPFPFYLMPPTDALTHDERWQLTPQGWDVHEAFFRQIVAAHEPHLILFDTFVPPRLHQVAVEHGIPEAVSLYRSASVTQQLAHYSDLFQSFELFIFPYYEHEMDDPDLPWVVDMDKVVYGGPLMRKLGGAKRVEAVKEKYNITNDTFTIVIANGGGTSTISTHDRFFELVLRGLGRVEAQLPPFQVLLITGPLHSHPTPYARFENGILDVYDFEVYLRALYASANLTITRSGYNTRTELAAIGVPAICVPLKASNDDQFTNLRLLAAQFDNLRFHTLDPDKIAATVLDISRNPWWHYQPQPTSNSHFSEAVVPRLLEIARS